jgi:hypothetical protein
LYSKNIYPVFIENLKADGITKEPYLITNNKQVDQKSLDYVKELILVMLQQIKFFHVVNNLGIISRHVKQDKLCLPTMNVKIIYDPT